MPAVPQSGACRRGRRSTPRLTPPSDPGPADRAAAPGIGTRRAARAARRRPTAGELADAAARGAVLRDVLAEDLDVLFCGINPGRWSGAVGHHFAHPGNRFWKALHRSGLTDEELSPEDEQLLLGYRLGITNMVRRTTATAAELTREELRRGAVTLERKVRRVSPKAVALLGLGAYRTAFGRSSAILGLQPECLGGRPVWVVPNPSGLQAHYGLERIVAELAALRRAVRTGAWPQAASGRPPT